MPYRQRRNGGPSIPQRRPNVLIFVLDSCRPELLSCYSGGPITTPNIDRVAAEGYLFETTIAPSVWTFPVMASVFTGMLPAKHGGHDEHTVLDSRYPTMAELFGAAGYDTAAISDVPYVGPMTRLDRGFRFLSNLQRHEVSIWGLLLKTVARAHRAITHAYTKTNETRIVIGESRRWLERRWNRSQPFLLYIHSDETHAPLAPPRRYRRRFTRLTARQMRAINQDKQLYVGGVVRMTDQDFKHLYALAQAEAAYFDEWFGRLLDYLERRRALDDTAIIVTADHGDNFGEHGLMRHGLCLYDTLLRVPLIIRPPGGCNGVRVQEMVQLIDVLPTLLRMAAINAPEAEREFQGRDLLERVRTKRFPGFVISELYRPTPVLFEKKVPHFMPDFRAKYDRILRSLRTNTHKFIWSSNGRNELYDLAHDPGENDNVVERAPQLAAHMQAVLGRWLASFPHVHYEGPARGEPAEDERLLARLRDLGYVG